MSIGKKLYLGFGSILAIVLVMFGMNIVAAWHEQTTKKVYEDAIKTTQALARLDQARMDNGLRLRDFLLTGEMQTGDAITQGVNEIESSIKVAEESVSSLGSNKDKALQLLKDIRQTEKEWMQQFATPLMAKRREGDAGNGTAP